jgi:hypothetical protein
MKTSWLGLVGALVPTLLSAQSAGKPAAPGARGPYARIASLRSRDGHAVDFEAGYLRHLEWHRQAGDTWSWYGWSVWASDRNRWFVYASFGHSAASLDSPVNPVEDERDNLLNVAPHVEWMGNALYEFLPASSRGTGEPQAAARVELTTVDLVPGKANAFEAALAACQPALSSETLWYRMIVGGPVPRYLRLRPRPSLRAILDTSAEQALPEGASALVAKATVEVLSLRPTLSLGLPPPAPE